MDLGFRFRLLYRVVFFCFCLIFACFYHGGGSRYDRCEDKTELNKLKMKEEFNDKPLNAEDERAFHLTENAKQIDGRKAGKKTDPVSKMVRKETAMKTLRSDRIRKSPVLPLSTPSLPVSPVVKVPREESTNISHSSDTTWQNNFNGSKNVSPLENRNFSPLNDMTGTAEREKFASLTTQHIRSRREIDATSESNVGPTEYAKPRNDMPIRAIIVMCAFVLSYISLVLLLIVYGMLPELRTLPGLNLMSLSFAFLFWQSYRVVVVSLYMRAVEMNNMLCAWEKMTSWFSVYAILMNSAVNVYHLGKTFCANILVKSDEKKWKTFLKYSLFSWGVPVIITIVHIVLVTVDALRFYPNIAGTDCVDNDVILPFVHVLPIILVLLYIIRKFYFSANQLRQNLKAASSSIAEKSNIVKNRNSFVINLKLFTITSLTYWLPLTIGAFIDNVHVQAALTALAFLTGFYIGLAFVFTRKNYKLLKKKYFPAKKKPIKNNTVVGM
ncbi:adhesion G- coupled receptor G2-like [Paramuricea clavata]|uniref:Adhesion G- coupled receptor G2-like n=1 Tax=Paramuricea clavata TaxID=317549 RepID=A0A6S7GD97_PARCT|nr:adhesion G- coupled receptor G2-like [Paramuricea clavata]